MSQGRSRRSSWESSHPSTVWHSTRTAPTLPGEESARPVIPGRRALGAAARPSSSPSLAGRPGWGDCPVWTKPSLLQDPSSHPGKRQARPWSCPEGHRRARAQMPAASCSGSFPALPPSRGFLGSPLTQTAGGQVLASQSASGGQGGGRGGRGRTVGDQCAMEGAVSAAPPPRLCHRPSLRVHSQNDVLDTPPPPSCMHQVVGIRPLPSEAPRLVPATRASVCRLHRRVRFPPPLSAAVAFLPLVWSLKTACGS